MKNNKTLELSALQDMLLTICSKLNRPIRKSQLKAFVTVLFECDTNKQVDFAILALIEEKQLVEYKHFIVTPDFYATWDKNVYSQDEGIIKFFLSLKEEIKHDVYFDVFAPEPLTPSIFFKYIEMTYPALLHREDAALAYMEQFAKDLDYALNNDFYAEKNDYPSNRRFTKFFDNPDCRIFIKDINLYKNQVSLTIITLPGKTRNYSIAKKQLLDFEVYFKSCLKPDMIMHTKIKPLSMLTGDNRRKH